MKQLQLYLFLILFNFTGNITLRSQNIDSLLQKEKEFVNHDSLLLLVIEEIADYYIKTKDHKKAEEYAIKGIQLCTIKNIDSEINKFYSTKGLVAYNKGNLKDAQRLFFKSLEKSEAHKDSLQIYHALSHIAMVYRDQGFLSKSQEYYEKCLLIAPLLSNKKHLAGCYSNLGLNYLRKAYLDRDTIERKNLHLGKSMLYKAYELSLKINEKLIQANSLGNLTYAYLQLQELDSASICVQSSIKIYKELKDEYRMAVSMLDIGFIMRELKRYKESEDYYNQSLAIAEKLENLELKKYAYQNLAQLHSVLGNYKSAYLNLTKYIRIHEELVNTENTKQINELQTKYETEKKEAENKVLQAQNEASLRNIELQKYGIMFIGVCLLLSLVFGFFYFKNFKEKKKANEIILLQKDEVEKQNLIIQGQKELVETQRKEVLDSIHYAKKIQNSLLNEAELINSHLENFIFFKPKDIVSGDFYWATIHNNSIYIAVCDSTGHGVPGAFMSLLNVGFLSEAILEREIIEPNRIFDYVRQRLISTVSKDGQKDGFDGILVKINLNEKKIYYAAANCSPLLIRNNKIIELHKDRMPVGIGEKTDSFSLFEITIQKNDHLYLYTDGFADQFGGPKGKKYKYKQLNELLANITENKMQDQKNLIESTFKIWQGELEQVDDVCIVGIKI